MTGLILGGLLVFSIGFLDDLYRLSPWPKLGVEIGASLLAAALGLQIQIAPDFLNLPFDLSWLSYPLTVLWLVGLTNAVNLADGVDGLAAGIATFAAVILFFMTFNTVHNVVALLSIALAGATIGFLRYNFHPATIFLGDSGSLFLGYFLGGLSIWASEKSTITFALLIPGIALGLPLADMAYAVLRRWNRGLPLKQADREHIHHKLLDMGFAQNHTVLILYGVNIVLVLLSALMLVTRNSLAAYVLLLLGLGLVAGSRLLGYFRFHRVVLTLKRRWHDLQQAKYLNFRTARLLRQFEGEPTLAGRWVQVTEIWQELGFRQASFTPEPSAAATLHWTNPDPAAAPPDADREQSLRLTLQGPRGRLGSLELTWRADGSPFPAGLDKILTVMVYEFGKPGADHYEKKDRTSNIERPTSNCGNVTQTKIPFGVGPSAKKLNQKMRK
ncbi:MAG: undecaprenyl/decaprenyl-phosphate alpha-N-acetylglucosaminyl 1-phosphate transferase [Desulfobacterota bacterium]|nr:undecaprenyl/decaprenyl-phosphate alpha-N-acetylglucosaminyl 1-phosphate transferase [Thermodesulfobacteriota bacterium]